MYAAHMVPTTPVMISADAAVEARSLIALSRVVGGPVLLTLTDARVRDVLEDHA